MERVVWVDVLLLALVANFIFDYLLLWATSEVSRTPSPRGRLALGALVGTLYFIAYLLAQADILPFFRLLRLIPVVVSVSILMLAVAFPRIPARRLLTTGGYFYLIGFASAGAGLSAAFLLGQPGQPHFTAGFFVAIASILLLAELGWGVVQRRLWLHVFQLPVAIRFGGHQIELTALVDTGNRLRDPLSGHPVIVVEAGALLPLLPPALARIVEGGDPYGLDALSEALAGTPWPSRFRLIPYHSIDQEHGMLIGFRPDALTIHTAEGPVATGDVIVGLCQRRLDPEGGYQALLHPDIVQGGLAGLARTAGATPGPQRRPAPERSPNAHASANPPA